MANQWFKFYGGEYLSDPKIDRLSPAERSCWLTLLCLASMSNKNGVIEYIDEHTLLKKSGVEQDVYGDDNTYDNTIGVITTFQKMNMLMQIDENTIQLSNWDKRQSMSMTGYERVKKHRENKKKLPNDNKMITHDNANDNIRIEENRIEENRIHNTWGDVGNSFWGIYPEKVAKAKALQSWIKLKEEEKQKAVAAIKIQLEANHFRGKDGKDYIPHPATWLNQKRWEDEIKKNNTPKGVMKF